MQRNRREFLEDVSSGMLIAGLGFSLASDLGVSTAAAGEDDLELDFGVLDSLVGRMQDTQVEKLQPQLIKEYQKGEVTLKQLTAAAALANAETFGGQDYVGFHTEMALLPALQMTADLPEERAALPVFKVLYRNTQRIHDAGLSKTKRLKKVKPADLPKGADEGQLLLDASRAADIDQGERIFAAAMQKSPKQAYNKLLWAVQDNSNVHRFALAHRAWKMIDIVGKEHAHTLLRQCIRFCAHNEPNIQRYHKRRGLKADPMRTAITRMVDQYSLLYRKPGTKKADDQWLESMSNFIFSHSNVESMDAVAAAIKEGFAPDSISQAISMAATQLVLRQDRLSEDSWRCHGATPGVHGADAANAWRNMLKVSSPRNVAVGLLVSAWHCGGSRSYSSYEPLPHAEDLGKLKSSSQKALLAEAEDAIRQNDQKRAAAAMGLYGQKGHSARAALDLMLKYAISEDGRLHSEKFYRTVTEEYAGTRPAFRWRNITALARVTASAYGYSVDDQKGFRADGYEEACRLLGVDA